MNNSAKRMGLLTLIGASLLLSIASSGPAEAWDRGRAELFAALPDGATGPEGIAVGPNGDVYVATFGFTTKGPVAGPGKIYVYNPQGSLLRTLSVAGTTAQLLGIGFHPTTHAFLVIDFGKANVRRVDPATGASSVFMTVTGSAGLNALTFDKAGNVYVSDSFQGIIWMTGPNGGAGTAWLTNSLLTTAGVPPFGANGLGFNKSGKALFVANTGNDTVVRVPVSGGAAGTPKVHVNSINGADGLILDEHDNLWVAANQSDELVVLSPSGKALAKLGDFGGVDRHGVPHGLIFPASPAFSQDGQWVFVANLALDLRLFGLQQTLVSQHIAQIKRYTVSKIRARIPPLAPDAEH